MPGPPPGSLATIFVAGLLLMAEPSCFLVGEINLSIDLLAEG